MLLNVRRTDGSFEPRDEVGWPIPRTRWPRLYLDPRSMSLSPEPVGEAASLDYDAVGEGVTFRTVLEKEIEIAGPSAARLVVSSSTSDVLEIEIWPTYLVIPASHTLALTIQARTSQYSDEVEHVGQFTITGVGPFKHDDPGDRPAETFGPASRSGPEAGAGRLAAPSRRPGVTGAQRRRGCPAECKIGSMPSFRVESADLYYVEAGTGPPAVFVPGFAQDHTFWADQVASLADRRHCVALDLRGFGRSEPIFAEALELETYANDLDKVIGLLGGHADVVCSGMGCAVGLELWKQNPGLVDSLALLGVGIPVLPRTVEGDGRGSDLYLEESARLAVYGGKSAIYEKFGAYILSPNASLRARARYRTMIDATSYEMFVGSFRAMGTWPSRLSLLESVDIPVLVVTGSDDTVFPPARARELFASSAFVEVVEVSGSGRLMAIEKPEATSAALREFWSRCYPNADQ